MIGWIGAACLALCALPQVVRCVINNGCKDISIIFLGLWFLGELCYCIATISEIGVVWWLLANYISNIVFVSIIIYYRIK